MTEQVQNQEVNTEVKPETNEPQYTPVEQKALEMGWRPKEEFDGAEEDFIDALEFVRRKPLFEKIDHQNREVKALRKALEAFKEHYTTVQKTEYERALRDLKASQKKALAEGDLDKYHELGEQKEQVEEEARKVVEDAERLNVQQENTPNPAFVSWVNRNQWYATQAHMRVFADELGIRLAQQGVAPDEVLKRVEQEVRKEFPNKFRNPNKDTAPSVEGRNASRPGSSKSGGTFELSEQEKNIMNTLVRGGHITKEKYIADLKAAKGL